MASDIFIKIMTHLKLTLQDMFRSFNDHHQLNPQHNAKQRQTTTRNKPSNPTAEQPKVTKQLMYKIDVLTRTRELNQHNTIACLKKVAPRKYATLQHLNKVQQAQGPSHQTRSRS